MVLTDCPDRAPRDDGERSQRGEAGDDRCCNHEEAHAGWWQEALLANELDEISDRLEEPVGPDSVRAVAQLHAGKQLAFHPRQIGEQQQYDVHDDERLGNVDPPWLVQSLADHGA